MFLNRKDLSSLMYLTSLCGMMVRVASIRVLQSDVRVGDRRPGIDFSSAKLEVDDGVARELQDVTVCSRFKLRVLDNVDPSLWTTLWLVMLPEEESHLNFLVQYPNSFFVLNSGFGSYHAISVMVFEDEDGFDAEPWGANRWMHACFSLESSTGTVRVVRDGEAAVTVNGTFPAARGMRLPREFLANLYLGSCPAHMDESHHCASPEGQYTDLNVWDRALTYQEMVQWTTCNSFAKGNLVAWETARFATVNMSWAEVATESVCQPIVPGNVVIPQPMNFERLASLCKKFHGKMGTVDSGEEMRAVGAEVGRTGKCSEYVHSSFAYFYWGGWWDTDEEGTYKDSSNTLTVQPTEDGFPNWGVGEPNGYDRENCVQIRAMKSNVSHLIWNDASCDDVDWCGFCELAKAPDFTLRGLCKESPFSKRFSWTRDLTDDRFSFQGFTDGEIVFANNSWVLSLYTDDSTYATTQTEDFYPFGQQEWTFNNDPCFGNGTATLDLNSCHLKREFNCHNGQCIPVEYRCDGKFDCDDRSDESSCRIYEKFDSYLQAMPPGPMPGDNVSYIFLDADILAIVGIEEVDSSIVLQIDTKLTWYDTRLTYLNLKEDSELNLIPLEDRRGELWIPQVIFHNTENKHETVDDGKAFAVVDRRGPYRLRNLTQLENAHLYAGEENPITLNRVHSEKLICEYDLGIYPFDSQKCFVTLVLKGKASKFAKILAGKVRYLGPVDLPQYFVLDATISQSTVPPDTNAVQLEIRFGRRLLSVMLNVYIPTFIICLVSFASNHFKSFYFEAVVTVNLTSLLALTTLMIGVTDSLPETSYIKMVDVWLIFCLLVPFSEVVLQTICESQRDNASTTNPHGTARFVGGGGGGGEVVDARKVAREVARSILREMKHGGATSGDKGNGDAARTTQLAAPQPMFDAFADKSDLDGIRNPRLYRGVKLALDRGMPFVFVAFIVAYFTVGLSFYLSIQ